MKALEEQLIDFQFNNKQNFNNVFRNCFINKIKTEISFTQQKTSPII